MDAKEAAVPDVDVNFFNELRTVFEKYPDAPRKYSISVRHNEIGKLKIDFSKQNGVSRVEGNRIVTEFKDISDPIFVAASHRCCERIFDGRRWTCARWCPE